MSDNTQKNGEPIVTATVKLRELNVGEVGTLLATYLIGLGCVARVETVMQAFQSCAHPKNLPGIQQGIKNNFQAATASGALEPARQIVSARFPV